MLTDGNVLDYQLVCVCTVRTALDGALASKHYTCSHLVQHLATQHKRHMGSEWSRPATRFQTRFAESERQEAEVDTPELVKVSQPGFGPRTGRTALMLSVPPSHTPYAVTARGSTPPSLSPCCATSSLRRSRHRRPCITRPGVRGAVQPPTESVAMQAYKRVRRELQLVLSESVRARPAARHARAAAVACQDVRIGHLFVRIAELIGSVCWACFGFTAGTRLFVGPFMSIPTWPPTPARALVSRLRNKQLDKNR